MNDNPQNLSAFPYESYARQGMTLRDYFAAKALQGLISNPNLKNESDDTLEVALANSSYGLADAMLERRSK